jgi:transcriptional regulator with XRE-family HTH domain
MTIVKLSNDTKKCKAVDIYLGRALRNRRRACGISQQEIATVVGVTFQQIQKYEKGKNRMSASTFYEISRFLKIDINYLFRQFEKEYYKKAATVRSIFTDDQYDASWKHQEAV